MKAFVAIVDGLGQVSFLLVGIGAQEIGIAEKRAIGIGLSEVVYQLQLACGIEFALNGQISLGLLRWRARRSGWRALVCLGFLR